MATITTWQRGISLVECPRTYVAGTRTLSTLVIHKGESVMYDSLSRSDTRWHGFLHNARFEFIISICVRSLLVGLSAKLVPVQHEGHLTVV